MPLFQKNSDPRFGEIWNKNLFLLQGGEVGFK